MGKCMVFFVLLISGCLFAETSPDAFQFEGLFKDLYMSGHYDLIEKIIDVDDVILEAGGFDGDDTIGLAKIVPQGKVISFEPNPPRYEELFAKTKDLPNVASYPFALGEKNGMVKFYVCYGAQYNPAFEGASSASALRNQ